MGDVYAAYDRKLGRRVALKLINERSESALASARFDREAQAIARLSHPNVIAIYDAGEFDERAYLAMEFVDGRTLSDWLADELRSWRQIRDVFAAAAEGLAAAHEAGLVHRDFKPQNVMVGRDGSVRVMDFGLAADVLELDAMDSESTAADLTVEPTSRTLALTRTGVLLGTPLYMAPEQFLRRKTDSRTDQFSFCVALYEALFGERPFASQSFSTLAGAVVGGQLREPAQKGNVPGFLWKLLVRGLAADPASRFSSMSALLEDLRHDPAKRRRRFAVCVGAAAVLVATAASGQRFASRGERMCRSGGDMMAAIWEIDVHGARREAIHRSFLSTGLGFAEDTWVRVAALLDDYSHRWNEGYTDTCKATHVRGDQSPEVMDLRMTCLEDARRSFKALTDVLRSTDTAALANAIDAARSLAPLERCADTRALLATTRLPAAPATRSQVAALQARLSEVKALAATGQLPTALRQIGPILNDARQLGFKPFLAETLTTRGWIDARSSEYSNPEFLEEAVWVSLAAGRDDLAADSAGMLVGTIGLEFARPKDAERWFTIAQAILERLGPGHDRSASWVYQGRALLREQEGRYGEGLADVTRALALKQTALPPDDPDIAISLYTLAQFENDLGQYEAALAAEAKAIEIFETAYGPLNPQLARPLCNRGETLMFLGRYSEAERDLRRAVDLSTAWVGASHPITAYSLTALGRTLEGEQHWREAQSILLRALRIREHAEPNPDRIAETRFALARASWEVGENRASARTLALAARDAYRQTPGHQKEAAEVSAWLAGKPFHR